MNEEIKHRKIFAQHCKECGQDYFMHPDEAISFFEEMEDLQSRLESLEKDAARYREIKKGEYFMVKEFVNLTYGWKSCNPPEMDERVDTAMQANKGE